MGDILSLDRIGLKSEGPTLTLTLPMGGTMAVCGPGGSGKSRFLRILSGQEKPGQGFVKLAAEAVIPQPLPRRVRVSSYLRHYEEFSELLMETGIWEHRQDWLSELPPSLKALLELLPCLKASQGAVFLDGYLDRLDPWVLPRIRNLMRRQQRQGVAFVAATHRPDRVADHRYVVVLRREEVRFAGTVEELLLLHQPHEVIVESHRQSGVKALVEPFEVTAEETEQGTLYRAKEGQELAAKLLLEGYGNVRQVMHRLPSIEEALRSIR